MSNDLQITSFAGQKFDGDLLNNFFRINSTVSILYFSPGRPNFVDLSSGYSILQIVFLLNRPRWFLFKLKVFWLETELLHEQFGPCAFVALMR